MKEPLKEPFSQEYLNAFVDDELVDEERRRALARLETDHDFKEAVCERRTLKELVRGAYADVPVRLGASGRSWQPAWRHAVAAALLVVLGAAGGWLARDNAENGRLELAGLPSGYQAVALTGRPDPDKILLHLDSSEPERLAAVLDLAETLLDRRGAQARLNVVVNSYGVNLLRRDMSPYMDRIRSLEQRHANLAFVACGQTVARLKREGDRVELLPEARLAPSAIQEITSRMGEGWVYIKV